MSIVEIKTLEKEVELLLAQYKDMQQGQGASQQGQGQGASQQGQGQGASQQGQGQQAKDLNARILQLLDTIKSKIDKVYPQGITNQNAVRMNNKNLMETSNKLMKEQKNLNNLIQEYNSLDGKNNYLTLQTNSIYYQYLFYLVIAIVISIYLIKIFTQETGYESADMIILVLAILLLLYHFISPFIQYGTDAIQSIVRKITGQIYLV
jgi:hypothetical protein